MEQGFGDDVYKLTMLSQRKKTDLIGSIDLMPGHKTRMIELFRRIENVSFEVHACLVATREL